MDTRAPVDTSRSTVVVYALVDPRTHEVRYIGKAADPEKRLRQHLRPSSLALKGYKSSWLKALLASGVAPEQVILQVVPADQANDAERWWIAMGRSIGLRLTNATDGGDGFSLASQSPEARARISQALRGRKLSAEHRRNLSRARRGLKVSDEGRKKISDRMKGTLPPALVAAVSEGRLPRGEAHHNARLNPEKVREIRMLAAAGESHMAIGRRMGVSNVSVANVLIGKTWAHVQ